MNDAERAQIEAALALLLKAKTSMRHRAMGGRNNCYDQLQPIINTIVDVELSLEPLLDPAEEEVEV